ncbi:hypothetical protein [Methylobacterium sp. J-068]|uniref:hypothetical protein n=1 Tax=Methylobacterium sp. J-068 TaxID=2836649 RepID=UPI001FB94040|nr:hypothetical protein [Methylobacterium sp. J-068]MCJ2035762.1 hypothetical protein [Methylobacterium sp. J-068]
MTKRLWSINALATELDADRRTIANALKRTPADGEISGHGAWFLTTALGALRPGAGSEEGFLDPVQERARKDRALAIQTELKNAIAQGEVVEINAVISEVTQLLGTIRSKLLGLPSRARSRFDLRKPETLYFLLEELVIEILTELSDPNQLEAVKDAERKQNRAARRDASSADRVGDRRVPAGKRAIDPSPPGRSDRSRASALERGGRANGEKAGSAP